MPQEAELLRMELGKPNVMDQFESGLIVPRQLPQQQSIEEWNEAWTEFKS
jgi:spermidine/putrescine transport system substrate-binding protein